MEQGEERFQPQERLGGSDHCEVWLAESAGGLIALKRARSLQGRQHLRLESAQLQRIHHPALPRLLAADPEGAWNALEYIPSAVPTRELADQQSLAERIEVVARLADVLGELHERGLIHSNLKPDHVRVDARDGRVRIIDLGGGPAAAGHRAPEVLAGGFPGPAADVYAFGAVAYQILTGEGPFAHVRTPAALDAQAQTSLPLPPSARNPRIPAALDEVVLRALARRPGARPRSLSLVARALRAAVSAPPAPVVVGMAALRRELRQRLVAALEGQGGGGLALVGERGSGRSALIAEVLAAARREQCSAVTITAQQERRVVLDVLRRGPFAATIEGARTDLPRILQVLQEERLPGLLLLEAASTDEVPAGVLREDCLEVPPLGVADVAMLLAQYGLEGAWAAEVTHMTRGLPRVVQGHLRRQLVPRDVTALERSLLLALSDGEPRPVDRLALRLGLTAEGVQEVARPLVRRGLLERSAEGDRLWAAPPRPRPPVSAARRGSGPASG